jgi:hypothetical protein
MQLQRVGACLAAVLVGAGMLGDAAQAGPAVSLRRDGGVEIAGRTVQCGRVRARLDSNLPGLGAAAPDARLLILNPAGLQRQPDTVRLFVFYHECGHHHVGASELQADCWGVDRGVREGWLDAAGLKQVCASFGGMPETPTHPSTARRCRNLNMCFGAATAAIQREVAAKVSADARLGDTIAKTQQSQATGPLSGPALVRKGALP